MSAPAYAFCEPVWASTITLTHIRSLEGRELKLGGGIDTPTLCKRLPYYGWDLPSEVTFESIKRGLEAEHNPVCQQCAREWGYRNGIEQDPNPRAWMTMTTPIRPDGTLDVENTKPATGPVQGQQARLSIIDEVADFEPGF